MCKGEDAARDRPRMALLNPIVWRQAGGLPGIAPLDKGVNKAADRIIPSP
jgi:hypothetical protein